MDDEEHDEGRRMALRSAFGLPVAVKSSSQCVAVTLFDTLPHIPIVTVATPLIAPATARNINARIKPYSTAVAPRSFLRIEDKFRTPAPPSDRAPLRPAALRSRQLLISG